MERIKKHYRSVRSNPVAEESVLKSKGKKITQVNEKTKVRERAFSATLERGRTKPSNKILPIFASAVGDSDRTQHSNKSLPKNVTAVGKSDRTQPSNKSLPKNVTAVGKSDRTNGPLISSMVNAKTEAYDTSVDGDGDDVDSPYNSQPFSPIFDVRRGVANDSSVDEDADDSQNSPIFDPHKEAYDTSVDKDPVDVDDGHVSDMNALVGKVKDADDVYGRFICENMNALVGASLLASGVFFVYTYLRK